MSHAFSESWDRVEAAYERDLLGPLGDFPPGILEAEFSSEEIVKMREQIEAEKGFSRPLLALIGELRRKGYDRLLHAHRSLLALGLATTDDYESWVHGPTVSIEASPDGNLTASYWTSETEREKIDISRAPAELVEPLLERLLEAKRG